MIKDRVSLRKDFFFKLVILYPYENLAIVLHLSIKNGRYFILKMTKVLIFLRKTHIFFEGDSFCLWELGDRLFNTTMHMSKTE